MQEFGFFKVLANVLFAMIEGKGLQTPPFGPCLLVIGTAFRSTQLRL